MKKLLPVLPQILNDAIITSAIHSYCLAQDCSMTTQRLGQQPDDPLKSQKRKRQIVRTRWLIAIIALLLIAGGTIFWLVDTQGSLYAILPIIIFTVLGVLIGLFQWLFPVSSSPSDRPMLVIHPSLLSEPTPPAPIEKTAHRRIVGLPPLADARTIQQRVHVVEEVYARLTQPDITAIALTGIGGAGKSTLAALIYRYTEEQRQTSGSPFQSETLWLTIDPAVTFSDLAGNLFEALERPLPDLGNLAPQSQAVALFNAMRSTDKPRLIVLDQFENLLDWDTGHALTDRPGAGEWLDIVNSQPCACRILLTSRPRPVGTRKYLPTYLQEYPVGGLGMNEGIALLQSQGVQGTDAELQSAVSRCAGHAFSLTLLATLMRDHHLDLTALLKNSALWTGDIASNLLDQIFTQRLNGAQRELLLAFSVYREPVPIEAALAIISDASRTQVTPALKVVVTQHLVEAVGDARYQLHAIIADYALGHFDESSEQANEEALSAAHAKAAQYYLQRVGTTCPPRGKRRVVSDVHELVEAIWQLCLAKRWKAAFDLMEQEGIYEDLNRWGSNAILVQLYQMLISSDNWYSDPSQEIQIYSNLGEVYRVLGRLEPARIYLQRALSICRRVESHTKEGWILSNLGRVYYDLGIKEQAKTHYEQALEVCRQKKDRAGEAMALNYLGRCYNSLEQHERARECYEQALSIQREIGDRSGEGWTLYSMGLIYNTQVLNDAKKEEALRYCEQALSIVRELGDRDREGWALIYLGRVYSAMGEDKKARQYFEEALKIHRRDRRS
jgi:tetratricopeptide (TPR) repeat protein